MGTIDYPAEELDQFADGVSQDIQVYVLAVIYCLDEPDQMRQNQPEDLVHQGRVVGVLEALVQNDESAKFADVSVVFVSVGLEGHLEDLVEERRKVDFFFELETKIPKDVPRLDPLENASEVVENRPRIVFGELGDKFVDSELVLVEDVVEVETDRDFAHFRHDEGRFVAASEVLIEEGQHLSKDLALQEGLPPHVPL